MSATTTNQPLLAHAHLVLAHRYNLDRFIATLLSYHDAYSTATMATLHSPRYLPHSRVVTVFAWAVMGPGFKTQDRSSV